MAIIFDGIGARFETADHVPQRFPSTTHLHHHHRLGGPGICVHHDRPLYLAVGRVLLVTDAGEVTAEYVKRTGAGPLTVKSLRFE